MQMITITCTNQASFLYCISFANARFSNMKINRVNLFAIEYMFDDNFITPIDIITILVAIPL